MKILLSGSTGFVGKALTAALEEQGHSVHAMSRRQSTGGDGIHWSPETGQLDRQKLSAWGAPNAVIHLAGENIASKRWTSSQKQKIRDSRVSATRKLTEELLKLQPSPALFLGASAVGFYGDRGDQILTEESGRGEGFLAEVASEWEAAAITLREAGWRTLHARFGMILDKDGGALAKMLPIFKLGLGGPVGAGDQWVSWITREDAVRALIFLLENRELEGAVNLVAPEPVRNRDFARELARALHRPAVVRAPVLALKMILGEMAEGLLLSSQRVVPQELIKQGFEFAHPNLREAFAALIRK